MCGCKNASAFFRNIDGLEGSENMAKCFICKKCNAHLDWNEQYSHRCDEDNQIISTTEKEECRHNPQDTEIIREQVMAKIRALAVSQGYK